MRGSTAGFLDAMNDYQIPSPGRTRIRVTLHRPYSGRHSCELLATNAYRDYGPETVGGAGGCAGADGVGPHRRGLMARETV
jgi:hypothetical protein